MIARLAAGALVVCRSAGRVADDVGAPEPAAISTTVLMQLVYQCTELAAIYLFGAVRDCGRASSR